MNQQQGKKTPSQEEQIKERKTKNVECVYIQMESNHAIRGIPECLLLPGFYVSRSERLL